MQNPLPRASAVETFQVLRDVQAPMVAKGPIIRRPGVVAAVERLGLEAQAVSRMRISEVYGRGPLMLRVPGRTMAMVLDPEHVHRILEETPEPFAPSEMLKRHALKHFEPKMALISHGAERHERRRINEQALDSDHPVHHMVEQFVPVVREEAAALLRETQAGVLSWEDFEQAWHRVVRRVVLGDGFRDDVEFTELLEKLRADGNWAFLKPVDAEGREQLHAAIRAALKRAEPGSLAAAMQHTSRDTQSGGDEGIPEGEDRAQQLPQWLFAFDPAGMATFRALALLAAHPERLDAARLQAAEEAGQAAPSLPLLRASVLESLRLWATTPMILRETTMEVEFEHGVMPAGASVLIFAPFFHRDERHLDFAHRFAPEIWERERTRQDWPLMPFSLGTGICPGRHLVLLLLTSNFLAEIVGEYGVELTSHELEPGSLPALLNNYGLQFRFTGR